jgi:hypothetical protein
MRSRVGTIGLGLLLLVCAGGCDGGAAPGAATLQVRNVSSQPIVIELDTPGTGLLGWLGGTDRQRFSLDPWQQGWCPTDRIGLGPGTTTVTVSGPQVQGVATHTWNAQEPASGGETDLNVVVAADGIVRFDGPVPELSYPCTSYPEATAPPQ